MFDRRTTRAIAVIAVAAGLILAGCGNDDPDNESTSGMDMDGSSAEASDAAAHNDADVMFAQMMIPHHEQAIEMADLAETRAESAEVKTLATEIRSAQGPEIEQMTMLLEGWGEAMGDMAGMGHSMGGMMSEQEMADLAAASGTEFDRQWLEMMIEHHEGAIEMSETEIDDGQSAEAIALAEDIVAAQQSEIERMQSLLT